MSDISAKLEKIFTDTFPSMKNFSLSTLRSEFENWDSLTHLQLVSDIETAFGVNFDMNEIAVIEKPEDFVPLLEKRNV